MKRNSFIWLLIFGLFMVAPLGLFANQAQYKLGSSDENLRKIFAQGKIINEGQNYLRSLQFENALAKYEEAADPKYKINGLSDSSPIGLKIDVLVYQAKYDIALELYEQTYLKGARKPDAALEKRNKLAALAKWRQTGDTKPIYEYIEYKKSKYAHWLPPKKLIATSVSIFSDLAELYDLLGDYDAGIAWAQSFKKTTKDKRDKQEYQNVIKAFEESKQGMPKICGDKGKICVGRATAYIIQSDQI